MLCLSVSSLHVPLFQLFNICVFPFSHKDHNIPWLNTTLMCSFVKGSYTQASSSRSSRLHLFDTLAGLWPRRRKHMLWRYIKPVL
jgi:hypothetical protein